MNERITCIYNTPELRKACRVLRRKLFLPKAQTSYDIAEIGGKVTLSSSTSEGGRILFLNIERPKESGFSRLGKGTPFQIRSILKNKQDLIAQKIEDLLDMMQKAAEDSKKFMTGF